MKTSTKYEYWKWAILQPLFENKNSNLILVHNNLTDKMYLYDIVLKRNVAINWDIDIEEQYIRDYIYSTITIGQLEKFYLSLPKKYQRKFWELLER